MKAGAITLAIAAAVTSCTRSQESPSIPVAASNQQLSSQTAAAEAFPLLSGKWRLHRGKAVDTLALSDTNGVIRGSVTMDKEWGGHTYDVHGLRVGQDVELFYTTERGDTPTGTTATYSFKGRREEDTIAGKCEVHLISLAGTSSDQILWIAEKEHDP